MTDALMRNLFRRSSIEDAVSTYLAYGFLQLGGAVIVLLLCFRVTPSIVGEIALFLYVGLGTPFALMAVPAIDRVTWIGISIVSGCRGLPIFYAMASTPYMFAGQNSPWGDTLLATLIVVTPLWLVDCSWLGVIRFAGWLFRKPPTDEIRDTEC